MLKAHGSRLKIAQGIMVSGWLIVSNVLNGGMIDPPEPSQPTSMAGVQEFSDLPLEMQQLWEQVKVERGGRRGAIINNFDFYSCLDFVLFIISLT